MNFIDEFHAQRRGIRGKTWAKWLFGRKDWRIRRGEKERIEGGGESGNILNVNAE